MKKQQRHAGASGAQSFVLQGVSVIGNVRG
jgi:hypothetical protein